MNSLNTTLISKKCRNQRPKRIVNRNNNRVPAQFLSHQQIVVIDLWKWNWTKHIRPSVT